MSDSGRGSHAGSAGGAYTVYGRNGGRGMRPPWRPGRGGAGRGRGGRGRGRFSGGGRRPGRRDDNNRRQFETAPEVLGTPTPTSLCVAVQGCCHGELFTIYQQIREHEQASGRKVDLLVCCGDFQSLRNVADYHSLAVPPKYRRLGTFCQYYSGELQAPVLTVFIGGNHEASQPLHELYYGGWVAPNIYYLGAAGVINIRGVRIGGISGIYKSHDYVQGRFERPPYDRSTIRSIYHVRNLDVYRLKCMSPERKRISIMLSHDWPQGIEQHGDTAQLLRRKPYFRDEVRRNDLGSPPNGQLLEALRPHWWFSAHLHVEFKATVQHVTIDRGQTDTTGKFTTLVPSQVTAAAKSEESDHDSEKNPSLSTEFVSVEASAPCAGPDLTDQMTQFLALDKCLPRRQHLSILHLPCQEAEGQPILRYDPEWLVILKKTHSLTEPRKRRVEIPSELMSVSDDEVAEMQRTLEAREIEGRHPDDPLAIPTNFRTTVPPHHDPCWRGRAAPLPMMGNPQTDELLSFLGLQHVISIPCTDEQDSFPEDENEIDLDADDEEEAEAGPGVQQMRPMNVMDDNEIDLDSVEEEEVAPRSDEQINPTHVVDGNEIDLDGEDEKERTTGSEMVDVGQLEDPGHVADGNELDLDEDQHDEDGKIVEAAGDSPTPKKARL